MASTFVSITTSAYSCVEFMLVCPSNSVTVSERRAWSLSSRKASASILPWRTGRRRMTGIRERRSWTQERPSSGTELLQGSRSNYAFNALFTSLNVAKVTMKEMGMEYSMSSFKSLMTNIYLVKRIFKASGYTPNRTLISKIFKDLSCLQRIAA